MSFKAMVWAWEVDGLTTTTKMVLLALANRASEDKGHCWPSIERIAAECRMGDRAVQNAIKTLEKEGYIRIVRRPRETNKFFLMMHLKIVAERVQEMHPQDEPRVHDVPNKGASGAPKPINETIKERTPVVPVGSQTLPGLEPPPNLLGKAKPAPAKANDTAALVEAWNAIVGAKRIPKVAMLTEARKATLLTRYEELGGTVDDWIKFCRRIARSPFLTGDNDRDWMPNFDWCLKPANFVKIIEGTYDDRNPSAQPGPGRFIPSPGTI